MKILQLTAHYYPNVGGLETHLSDLVKAQVNRKHNVDVLTYQPLMTKSDWKMIESKGKNTIYRIPYISGLFYRFVENTFLIFIYLMPGLFATLPFYLLLKRPDVIHTHGLAAGFVGVFWGKVFGIRTITTTHNIYNFPKSGLYRDFATMIFSYSDHVLTLSKQSKDEIKSLGIDEKNITNFTYWIDLKRFKKTTDKKLYKKYKGFNVLFVGRLVKIKGVEVLLNAASNWNKNIDLILAGDGPLMEKVEEYEQKYQNIHFVGRLSQSELPKYYSLADIFIIPSTNEEGFGRVIIESLACGTPVVGANKGGIPEALDESVGELIKVTPTNIKKVVEKYYKNQDKLEQLAKNARRYAVRKYSEKNVETIIKTYSKKA